VEIEVVSECAYPRRRMRVLARIAVATSQSLAARSGPAMPHRGATAFDGTVAAAATLAVPQPTSNGVGSAACEFVWNGSASQYPNGSGRSPLRLTTERVDTRLARPMSGTWPSTDRCMTIPPFYRLSYLELC